MRDTGQVWGQSVDRNLVLSTQLCCGSNTALNIKFIQQKLTYHCKSTILQKKKTTTFLKVINFSKKINEHWEITLREEGKCRDG